MCQSHCWDRRGERAALGAHREGKAATAHQHRVSLQRIQAGLHPLGQREMLPFLPSQKEGTAQGAQQVRGRAGTPLLLETEFSAHSQLGGIGKAGGWGMEKFRSPVPCAAAARKHQTNGCSRVGRENPAPRILERRLPTVVWLVTCKERAVPQEGTLQV